MNESESSSEDEACMFKNPQYFKDMYLTLGAMASKDPNMKGKSFLKEYYEEPEKERKEKPLRLAEYQNKMLIDKNGQLSDEEEITDDEIKPVGYLIKHCERVKNDNPQPKTIGFEDDNISDDDGEMFMEKKKSGSDNKYGKNLHAADEMVQFLKGNIDCMTSRDEQNIVQPLRDIFNDPDLPEEERWLNNFFLDQANAPSSNDEGSEDGCIVDHETVSEDEQTYNKMVEFDALHRFRFEENNEDAIKNYPRLLVNSVRIKSNKRKTRRNEVRERKKREKEEKIREYKELKNVELAMRLEELKKAGIDANFHEELEDRQDPKDFALEFIEDKPVIFKYHSVAPNSYGLSTADILQANDEELEKFVSWKIVSTCSDAVEKSNRHKARHKDLIKILPSLFEDPGEKYEDEKRKKYDKKKSRKQRNKKRNKRKAENQNIDDLANVGCVDESRLAAFNLNAKKAAKKMKYV